MIPQSATEIRAQNIIMFVDCALPRVFYPHRKTPDLYGVAEGRPIRCFQCETDVKVEAFYHHIRSHGQQSKNKPILVTDGKGKLWAVPP